jgi:hypothetical protein
MLKFGRSFDIWRIAVTPSLSPDPAPYNSAGQALSKAAFETIGETDMSRDWLELCDEHGVEFVVLDVRHDGDLAQTVRSRPGWTVDFEDQEAVIFTRTASRVASGLGLERHSHARFIRDQDKKPSGPATFSSV